MVLALVIGLGVVVCARQMLSQLTLADKRLDEASTLEARERNTTRYAEDLVNRLEVGTDSVSFFAGEPTQADFTTWCAVPRGWLERCGATLAVDTLVHPYRLYIATTRGDTVVLKRNADFTTLRYFSDPEDADTWVLRWGRGITTPAGVAIVTPFDTTLIRIGSRG